MSLGRAGEGPRRCLVLVRELGLGPRPRCTGMQWASLSVIKMSGGDDPYYFWSLSRSVGVVEDAQFSSRSLRLFGAGPLHVLFVVRLCSLSSGPMLYRFCHDCAGWSRDEQLAYLGRFPSVSRTERG